LGTLLTGRRALIRLLQARFGPLSPAALARIDALEAAALDDALLRVLTADGVDDVLG
jgi:hypothetical protein